MFDNLLPAYERDIVFRRPFLGGKLGAVRPYLVFYNIDKSVSTIELTMDNFDTLAFSLPYSIYSMKVAAALDLVCKNADKDITKLNRKINEKTEIIKYFYNRPYNLYDGTTLNEYIEAGTSEYHDNINEIRKSIKDLISKFDSWANEKYQVDDDKFVNFIHKNASLLKETEDEERE